METIVIALGLIYFMLWQGIGVLMGTVTWAIMSKRKMRGRFELTAAMLFAWPITLPIVMVYV